MAVIFCEAMMELLVPTQTQEQLDGLRLLLGGPPPWDQQVEEQLRHFLDYASQVSIDLAHQVQCRGADGTILGVTLWIEAPGRTALMMMPNMMLYGSVETSQAVQACLRQALQLAKNRGVVLGQVMADPFDQLGLRICQQAGLENLATLIYMERRPPVVTARPKLPEGIRLEPYSRATHDLFRQAILGSYRQTLDCPRLSSMRDIEDVITSHKAVGPFDPQLWTVVVQQDQPVGCLLLAELPLRHALELVYLGLAPEGRGKGLGRLLLQRMLYIACQRNFGLATLAVDAGNAPAMALYGKMGFHRTIERVAMIGDLRTL